MKKSLFSFAIPQSITVPLSITISSTAWWGAFLAVCSVPAALAQTSGTRNDINHFISAGAGIAHPSVTGATGSNPAGQIYHTGLLLHHAVATSDAALVYGQSGLIMGGNSFFGATLGISEFESFQYNNKSAILGQTVDRGTLFQAGWAGFIPRSRFAFGMSLASRLDGVRVIAKGGSSTSVAPTLISKTAGLSLNLGLLFDPHGPTRIGITAYQVADQFDTLGFGFAFDVVPQVTFVLDGTYTRSSKSMNFVPAMAFAHPAFQASIGYGLAGMGDGWSWAREGLSGSISFSFLRSMAFMASVNQIQHVYVGVTARM